MAVKIDVRRLTLLALLVLLSAGVTASALNADCDLECAFEEASSDCDAFCPSCSGCVQLALHDPQDQLSGSPGAAPDQLRSDLRRFPSLFLYEILHVPRFS